ncbi:MAG TPA: hypothetical protein VG815_08310, partial [Chloroflexota bacterium]|nr:hypothetical protein [Chloroflexota bacterium]
MISYRGSISSDHKRGIVAAVILATILLGVNRGAALATHGINGRSIPDRMHVRAADRVIDRTAFTLAGRWGTASGTGQNITVATGRTGLKVIDLGLENADQWYAVNDGGQVAGTGGTKAARWENGVVTEFGTSNGNAIAYGIDDTGDLFGYQLEHPSFIYYPARWDAKGAEHIDTTKPSSSGPVSTEASPNGTAVTTRFDATNKLEVFVSTPPSYIDETVPKMSVG